MRKRHVLISFAEVPFKSLEGLEPSVERERQAVTLTRYGKKPLHAQLEAMIARHDSVTILPDGNVIGRDFDDLPVQNTGGE